MTTLGALRQLFIDMDAAAALKQRQPRRAGGSFAPRDFVQTLREANGILAFLTSSTALLFSRNVIKPHSFPTQNSFAHHNNTMHMSF